MKRRNFLGFSLLTATFITSYHQLLWGQSSRGKLDDTNLPTLASSAKSTTAEVSVDWKRTVARATPLVFGSNDYEITSPRKAADSTFQKLVSELDIRLIRIHHSELSDRWTDLATKSWDESKIEASFDVSYPHKPAIVQNIPNWPSWMKQQKGLLDPSEYDNYADFCAELVKILNTKQGRKILYWEPFNERDKRYEEAGKLDELWKIFNKVAIKMKAQDPQIKVGGPVLTWDDPQKLKSFLKQCDRNVDFISWHRYASGNAEASTDKIMAYTPKYGKQVRRFRSIVAKHIPERKVPLFLSEYNINYSWKSGENRQNTHIGAVWFASVLKHLAEAGIDMATSWHLKDGVYGMIDPRNNLRPSATVFAWANKYLTGRVVRTESNLPAIEAFAVSQPKQRRSLLLINKSSENAVVSLKEQQGAFKAEETTIHHLDEGGIRSSPTAQGTNLQALTLNPYSLLLLASP